MIEYEIIIQKLFYASLNIVSYMCSNDVTWLTSGTKS